MLRSISSSLLGYKTIRFKTNYSLSIHTLPSSHSTAKPKDRQSLIVSYLTNSRGLSLESAISASKSVKIRSTRNADMVLKLLRSHGFTQSDIARLISKHPRFISCRADTNLGPKIEFFLSLGFIRPDLPKFLLSHWNIRRRSLKQMVSAVSFLKSVLRTDENVVLAFKQGTNNLLFCDIHKTLRPNISTLLANRVPKPHIERLVMAWPKSLTFNAGLFKKIIDEVKGMGFDPRKQSFVLAIHCISWVSKSKRERKLKLLRSLGWSETEVRSALSVQPMLLLCSEEKIRTIMHFLVNKVGLAPSDVAIYPNVFLLSFERRIIPRYSVFNLLVSKGLVKQSLSVLSMLIKPKAAFEEKFVICWKEDCPEVIKAYGGEIEFQGSVN
ncbi:hypothetical protein Tsubulata_034075 [Turnera subulata]|uniref:Uncharacterized protein n=1 Tax=Turnera subulata TaxID=218843 RepID=A0A9Q0G3G0_9ROSI|nr:hypothetical protein Tsubulata_034075 [Turnera subulata]